MSPVRFFERMRLILWRHVLFWCVWYGLRSSRTCFYIDASDSLLWLTSTRTQIIPDASEKDAMSRNQTHALKKRTGRMPCAYSLNVHNYLQGWCIWTKPKNATRVFLKNSLTKIIKNPTNIPLVSFSLKNVAYHEVKSKISGTLA